LGGRVLIQASPIIMQNARLSVTAGFVLGRGIYRELIHLTFILKNELKVVMDEKVRPGKAVFSAS